MKIRRSVSPAKHASSVMKRMVLMLAAIVWRHLANRAEKSTKLQQATSNCMTNSWLQTTCAVIFSDFSKSSCVYLAATCSLPPLEKFWIIANWKIDEFVSKKSRSASEILYRVYDIWILKVWIGGVCGSKLSDSNWPRITCRREPLNDLIWGDSSRVSRWTLTLCTNGNGNEFSTIFIYY